MNKFRLVLVGCLLVILAVMGWWFYTRLEYVYEDQKVPPRGQATYDPLYAASVVLKANGVSSELHPYLDFQQLRPGNGDTLVYYGDINSLTPEQVWQLDRFVVQQGGHLVVQLPAYAEIGDIPLLASFHIRSVSRSGCGWFRADAADRADPMELCGANAVTGKVANFDYAAGRDEDLQYAQRSVGKGWVAVLSDLDFMTNLHIKDPVNLALMQRVLQAQPGHGRVLLIYSFDSEGLPILLLRYGWTVLLPLGLCLIALLWRLAPRFGPPLQAGADPRRSMLEHMRAGGEFLWREGRPRILLEAVCDDMLLTLRRRHPAASRAESRALLDSLTAITGLPRVQVRRALGQDGGEVKEDFTQRIATLIKIRKHL